MSERQRRAGATARRDERTSALKELKRRKEAGKSLVDDMVGTCLASPALEFHLS